MDTMSRWLDAIAADTSARTARRKVAADRPADAADACFTADGTRHEGSVTLGGGNFCSATFPAASYPRLVAGACNRRHPAVPAEGGPRQALRREAHPDPLQRLRRIFPHGVCDYGRPSQNASRFGGTWLSFGGGASRGALHLHALSADFHATGSAQGSVELVARGVVAPPGDGGLGGEDGFAQHG
jgi:hypothetical protein